MIGSWLALKSCQAVVGGSKFSFEIQKTETRYEVIPPVKWVSFRTVGRCMCSSNIMVLHTVWLNRCTDALTYVPSLLKLPVLEDASIMDQHDTQHKISQISRSLHSSSYKNKSEPESMLASVPPTASYSIGQF